LRAFLALFLVFTRSAAVGVIGQSDINLGAGGVNLNVFWAVHLVGTDFIGSLTGEDSNFLSGETIDVRFVLSVLTGQYWLPGTVAIESPILWEPARATTFVLAGIALHHCHVTVS